MNGKHSFYNYGVLSRGNNKLVTNESLFELGSVSKTFTLHFRRKKGYQQIFPEVKNTVFDEVTDIKLLDTGSGLIYNAKKTVENWATTITNPTTFYRTTIRNFVLEI